MAQTATRWVNPEVLKWARERIGLSPEEVEEHSKKLKRAYVPIRAEELIQWEYGKAEPELEHLETLSEVYVCPVGYFFLSEPPLERLPLSFRGLAEGKENRLKPLSRQTLRRFLELAEWTAYIIDELGVEWEAKIPLERELKRSEEIDRLVQQERERLGFAPSIRNQWRDTNEAFLWWRKKIESRGIFCFEMKLEPGDIRGASIWLNSRLPFILVNHQDIEAATGRTFTLLHEYAHLLIQREGLVCDFRGHRPGENPEPFANRFAARMLLSYEELKARLHSIKKCERKQNWSDTELDEIREPFFVSRDVVAIALEEIELAPKGFYQKKREQWESRKPWGRGGRGRRPTNNERALHKIGYSLARVLSLPSKEESLSWTDLAYVLDMKVERVEEFLNWARGKVISA